MKVRFGVGLGADVVHEELPGFVDQLEAAGIDSLWFSELVYTPAVDPFVGMAFTLARTTRLKVGTSVAVLPGRNPVLVAKQLASLAALVPKRVLPVFGLRSAMPAERDAFVVPEGKRCGVRRVTGVAAHRPARRQRHVRRQVLLRPRRGRPPQTRCTAGHLARRGDARRVSAPRRVRPDLDPAELVAADWDQLHRLLDDYVAAGLTKFVIRPAGAAAGSGFVDRFTNELLPRQN